VAVKKNSRIAKIGSAVQSSIHTGTWVGFSGAERGRLQRQAQEGV